MNPYNILQYTQHLLHHKSKTLYDVKGNKITGKTGTKLEG